MKIIDTITVTTQTIHDACDQVRRGKICPAEALPIVSEAWGALSQLAECDPTISVKWHATWTLVFEECGRCIGNAAHAIDNITDKELQRSVFTHYIDRLLKAVNIVTTARKQ